MNESIIVLELANTLGLPVTGGDTSPDRKWLAAKVNDLVETDFERLVFLLYRMDVNEAKLRRLLKENAGKDAGLIIADLMIERQEQKIKSKNEMKRDENIEEDEKW